MTDVPVAQKKPDPCCFVIFGATGDLAHRLVLPALYNLAATGLLPDEFCIIGVARNAMPSEALRDSLMKGLRQFATRRVDDMIAKRLLDCVTCVAADPGEPASFDRLRDQIDMLEGKRKTGGNRLFYLATPPNAFAPITRQLGRVGLLKEDAGAWRRLVVEKPFGTDLASARKLNQALLEIVDEHQIYRMDHYLGKETVQNILVLRFANGMFEPIWNRNHIDHVQITVDEKIGVGHRGSFYDATGALRDMVPNHLFQLLSLIAMEPPARFDAYAVRSEKAEVLAAIQTFSEEEALQNSVRGQYRHGRIGDTEIEDYRKTRDVKPDSTTETYVALKLMIDSWRWAGVPFYLRTGKALSNKRTEVAIKFKQAPLAIFRGTPVDRLSQNYLVIGIEPTEDISLQFNAKVPGPAISIDGVEMKFRYRDYFKGEPSTGYETLIYDCMIGDNLLFQRADSVEAGWQAVQPFLDAWKKAGADGLESYRAGSEGPSAANVLLARDGRSWRSTRAASDVRREANLEKNIKVITVPDAPALAKAAADRIMARIAGNTGRVAICLSGGSSPKQLYQLLGTETYRSQIPWNRVHWFIGDERFVPATDPLSNMGMARQAFLDRCAPAANVHPIPTDNTSPQEAARRYERELKSFYGADELDPARPLFDVVLLGVGPDGHTASLFPGYPAVEETRHWVIDVPKAHVEPFVPRVTLTLPALDCCREMLIEANGAGKRTILTRVFAGEDLPVNRAHAAGETVWLVDAAALPENFP